MWNSAGGCPGGSLQYGGHCYRLKGPQTYNSQASCPDPEYLAEITDENEDDAIAVLLVATDFTWYISSN